MKQSSPKSSTQSKWKEILDELVGFAAIDVRELGKSNAALWEAHTTQNKQLVLEAAQKLDKKGRCAILGAGPCYDIPLLELAQMFEQVELFDLNAASLMQAVSELPEELASKLKCSAIEVTQVLSKVLYEIKQEILKAGTRSQRGINRAIAILDKQSVGIGALAEIQGDLIVSDMILSQLSTSLWLVEKWCNHYFRKSIAEDADWLRAIVAFQEKVQGAHVEGLLAKRGAMVVLATDIGIATSLEEAHFEELERNRRVTLADSALHYVSKIQENAELSKTWVWHRDASPPKFSPVWGMAFRPEKIEAPL